MLYCEAYGLAAPPVIFTVNAVEHYEPCGDIYIIITAGSNQLLFMERILLWTSVRMHLHMANDFIYLYSVYPRPGVTVCICEGHRVDRSVHRSAIPLLNARRQKSNKHIELSECSLRPVYTEHSLFILAFVPGKTKLSH